jgi:hypothetical protein
MEQPIEATIRRGYNMNINDKIDILNSRIESVQVDIMEHNRILAEEMNLLQDGDEEVIRKSLFNLYRSLDALNDYMQVLTNSSEML